MAHTLPILIAPKDVAPERQQSLEARELDHFQGLIVERSQKRHVLIRETPQK